MAKENNNIPTGLYWHGKKDGGMNKEEMQDFGFQPAEVEIRRQEEFYKLTHRFGSVPVDEVLLR